MKAGRLTRKTHLKRHSALPMLLPAGGAPAFYDLVTEDGMPDADVIDLTADQGFDDEIQTDEGYTAVPLRQLVRLADEIAFDLHGGQAPIFSSQDDMLIWSVAVLNESPAARSMMLEAAETGWSIGMADLQSGGFYLDMEQQILLLDHFSVTPLMLGRSTYFRNALVTTMIRALRDIWHEQRYEEFEKNYRPEDVLMLERIRAADCDTVTIHAGWELRGAGFPDIWRHLLGSEEGDMAMTFARYLERDPGALFDGAALACAFRQWYADPARVDACDHETLENLDILLVAAEQRNPFGARDLNAEMVESMAKLPDGRGYLAGLGRTVMADPVFAGLGDPVNQTHLFHLMYDIEVTMVNNVPFRDTKLARKIFPQGGDVKSWR